MSPAALAILQTLAAIEFADGDRTERLADVRKIVKTMPRAELIDCLFTLCDRFSRAIEATRDHVELLAITEFDMMPDRVDHLNLPTMVGSLLGLAMPEVKEGSCCDTCAFRQGSAANQCTPTVLDALQCAGDGAKFFCHDGVLDGDPPIKVCRGWAQAIKLEGAGA